MYKIDHDVPIPLKKAEGSGRKRGRPHGTKYPFADMAHGDSFLIEHLTSFNVQPYKKFAKEGCKFISRANTKGVRIFCVRVNDE